jgi:GNAT superfamily N-acetyltransferase
MISIRKADSGDAGLLSEIAFAAKAHWDYPSSWMEQWRDEFIFPPEYFEANESWVVEVDDAPVAFCTLQEKEDHAWLENLWVSPEHMRKGISSQLFAHVVKFPEVADIRDYALSLIHMRQGFTKNLACIKSASAGQTWKIDHGCCRSWRSVYEKPWT